MWKLILLILIYNLASTPSTYLFSQSEYNLPESYPGSITLTDSTKLVGQIKALGANKPYKKVILISPDGTKKKFKPSMALKYSIQNQTYISVRGKFMELIHKGSHMSLLKHGKTKWYSTHQMALGMPMIPVPTQKTTYYLQRKDPRFVMEVRAYKFKSTFSNYFKDCPDIANLIAKGDYKHDDIQKIVWAYNACKSREN